MNGPDVGRLGDTVPGGASSSALASAARATAPAGGAGGAGGGEPGGAPSSDPPVSVALPKGGGAIRSIGEKFTANPANGTASLSVPITASAGRDGFGPDLALTYDSGTGNGSFGIGWRISLPSIARKVDKGVPRYGHDPEDVFVLSGAEDLLPVLEERDGDWRPAVARRWLDGREYLVQRYRPRIEAQFVRIERWTEAASGDVHWRSITRDNVTTRYGVDRDSRIASPADPSHVFSWLMSETYDDLGNAVRYEYKRENTEGIDTGRLHECSRTTATRTANCYLKRILYGNRVSRLIDPELSCTEWLFEVVCDYGEHDADEPTPREVRPWECRADPYSSYRTGFEVRTYRLCQRVLVFHHIPEEDAVGRDCLVQSTELRYRGDARRGEPTASFLVEVVQRGHRRRPEGGYRSAALPSVELAYNEPVVDELVRSLDQSSLENLPIGLNEPAYRWIDLDGDGISGVLTEQGGSWLYKANLGRGRFAPAAQIATLPTHGTADPAADPRRSGAARPRLLDLNGDGRLELVDLSGRAPGYYERTEDRDWTAFVPFKQLPNIRWDSPSVRLVDLNGDGQPDVLVTEDDALTWYAGKGGGGFEPGQRTYGEGPASAPRLLLGDSAEGLYLADMSGDGLSDLVRIRNGEVCYWPNLGYGRFGPRTSMDGAPWLDEPEQFDQRRVRLADVDGSGTTDLIYLHRDGVRLYANQAGNGFAPARVLRHGFPDSDALVDVSAVDLLGQGTACLVWSSPLPGDARRVLRYVDLMGGVKPHLLVRIRNSLGGETRLEYAPSTRFYLEDRANGRPWVTRLPFPVHVLERVTVADRVSRSRAVTRYAYHHGYYDGTEREFRGFGLVDRFDSEDFDIFEAGTPAAGLDANVDRATHLPPTLTRTWFHTGAPGRVLLEDLVAERHRPTAQTPAAMQHWVAPVTLPGVAGVDEEREAYRTLRGSILREEVYGLDGSAAAGVPYSVSQRGYRVRRMQPRAGNPYASFFVHRRDSVNYQLERDDRDPRVLHELVLEVDPYGTPVRTAHVAYGRADCDLVGTRERAAQEAAHGLYTAVDLTNAVDEPDAYRAPVAWQTRNYELELGARTASRPLSPADFADRTGDLLGSWVGSAGAEPSPADNLPRLRLIGVERTRHRPNDLGVAAGDNRALLRLGRLESRALRGETYRLAFTPALVTDGFPEGSVAAALASTDPDGGGYMDCDGDGNWWWPSGRTFYHPDWDAPPATELAQARRQFFKPRRLEDPFGATTRFDFDRFGLLPTYTRDPAGNEIRSENDYRVVKPALVTDPNGNRTAVAFDALGRVTGTAVTGKAGEQLGDSLAGFEPDVEDADLAAFFDDPLGPHAARLLAGATTRTIYDDLSIKRHDDRDRPTYVATIMRETRVSDELSTGPTPLQISFVYTDGLGREIQHKARAEPGPLDGAGAATRWATTAWSVVNNKGKPVRTYEPLFDGAHQFRFAAKAGASRLLVYDPPGRVIATVHPDHSYEKLVIGAWSEVRWDRNDTALLDPRTDADLGANVTAYAAVGGPLGGEWTTWYARRAAGQLGEAARDSAAKTAAHAGTPTTAQLDALGRTMLTVEDNGVDEHGRARLLRTFVERDANDDVRMVVDARGRVVIRYDYDLAGTRIHQTTMERGEHWTLSDIGGRPIRTWDSRGHRLRTAYDSMRRPVRTHLAAGVGPAGGGAPDGELLVELTLYGERHPAAAERNLRGRVFAQFDQAGCATNERFDFAGNLTERRRRFATEYRRAVDWSDVYGADGPAAAVLDEQEWQRSLEGRLEGDALTHRTTYDALNRPLRIVAPDGTTVESAYNVAGLLEQIGVELPGADEQLSIVHDLDYDARGQRTAVEYGNGASSRYEYEPQTARLTRIATRSRDRMVQDLRLSHDPAGNVDRVLDHAEQTLFFANTVVRPGLDLVHDPVYRLVGVEGREHATQLGGLLPPDWRDGGRSGLPHPADGRAMRRYVERYDYDDAGNLVTLRHRTAAGGWTRHFDYEAPSQLEPELTSNRLTSTRDGEDTMARYRYDPNGNLVEMRHLPSMGWDHLNRLTSAVRQVRRDRMAETVYHVYDSSGRRARTVVEREAAAGGQPTRRSDRRYAGNYELFRRHGAHGRVKYEHSSLHVMDDERRVALIESHAEKAGPGGVASPLVRYQLGDHLDSSTVELDEAGRVLTHEEYYAFGATSYQAMDRRTRAAAKRYRFTGMERDSVTGLAYHGMRYYAPWLCRWTSPDPAGLADGENLYTYAGNRPLRGVDPTGTQTLPKVGSIYRIEGVIDGQPVVYVGSARELKNRLNSGHKWAELIRANSTKISVKTVTAQLDVTASGRGTLASARNEALRGAEQRALQQAEAAAARRNANLKPGQQPTKVLNVDRAAANPAEFEARHQVATSSRWRTIKVPGGGVKLGAFGALQLLDIYRMYRDEKLAQYQWAPYLFEDDGGVFNVSYQTKWWFFTTYWKDYLDGAKKGQSVEISSEEAGVLKDEGKALYGTTDWLGDFVPGLLNPVLPVAERDSCPQCA